MRSKRIGRSHALPAPHPRAATIASPDATLDSSAPRRADATANPDGVIRYRADLSDDELPERPGLQLRISGKNLPAEGVMVYESHYFHSGDPRDH